MYCLVVHRHQYVSEYKPSVFDELLGFHCVLTDLEGNSIVEAQTEFHPLSNTRLYRLGKVRGEVLCPFHLGQGMSRKVRESLVYQIDCKNVS